MAAAMAFAMPTASMMAAPVMPAEMLIKQPVENAHFRSPVGV